MNRVQRTMDRVKAIVLGVLPVLWLLALSDLPATCACGFSDFQSDYLISASKSRRDDSLMSAWLTKSSRRSGRRVGTQVDRDDFLPDASAELASLQRRQPDRLLTQISTPPGLSPPWQFHLRAAAEPRAPSCA